MPKGIIYLDMDDVVADFTGYAVDVVGYDPRTLGLYKYPDNDWILLRNNPRIYRDLEVIPGAIDFVDELKSLDMDLRFLTAIPSGNDVPFAFQDKMNWARQHFPGIDVLFGPYSEDKVLRAKSYHILVDDRKKNIDAWVKAGGLGVWHQFNYNQTLEKIKECIAVI